MLFPTTIVGSFPQPDWLIDRAKLAGRFPPRVRARDLWRVEPPYHQQADGSRAETQGRSETGSVGDWNGGPGAVCGNRKGWSYCFPQRPIKSFAMPCSLAPSEGDMGPLA